MNLLAVLARNMLKCMFILRAGLGGWKQAQMCVYVTVWWGERVCILDNTCSFSYKQQELKDRKQFTSLEILPTQRESELRHLGRGPYIHFKDICSNFS